MLSIWHEILIYHYLITLTLYEWNGYSNLFFLRFNLHFTGQFSLQENVVLWYNYGTIPWHLLLDNHNLRYTIPYELTKICRMYE
jgi:hypothetical protein